MSKPSSNIRSSWADQEGRVRVLAMSTCVLSPLLCCPRLLHMSSILVHTPCLFIHACVLAPCGPPSLDRPPLRAGFRHILCTSQCDTSDRTIGRYWGQWHRKEIESESHHQSWLYVRGHCFPKGPHPLKNQCRNSPGSVWNAAGTSCINIY